VDGFKVTLIIAAALCLTTAVVSFALPGRAASPRNALTIGEERNLEELINDEAELAGTGLIAGKKSPPSGPSTIGRNHE
jgi:hypothetical protein